MAVKKEPVKRVQEFISSCNDLNMARGAKLWQNGVIPNKPDDNDFNPCTPEANVWLGYMLARALDYSERVKVAEMLECNTENVEVRD